MTPALTARLLRSILLPMTTNGKCSASRGQAWMRNSSRQLSSVLNVFGTVTSQTRMQQSAPRQNATPRLWNRSCPAVSQICHKIVNKYRKQYIHITTSGDIGEFSYCCLGYLHTTLYNYANILFIVKQLTCRVTTLLSTVTSFVRKSAPIVALYWLVNFLLTN